MSSLHDPRYRALINKLRKIRESKGMTQVELASSLKKPQSYIAKVENFERRLDIIELHDWLVVLDTKISVFFKT
ncbi:helix-turn-helix domain-containing protein [Acinetobacter sp. 8I-beige]|uniref:helix-turn-helix domain-containing protein n=1 Tax=Acinetobacter sp. 8I-beige TaxID=2653125 RepID=UPI001330BC82|nr:helix-turn-helix transcriptional regulator [Acinetobacter sp. 8I-beige]